MKQKYLIVAVVVVAILIAAAFVYSYLSSPSQKAAPSGVPPAPTTSTAQQPAPSPYYTPVYVSLMQEILKRDAPAGSAPTDFTAYKIVGGSLSPSGDRTAVYFATKDPSTADGRFVNNGIFYVVNGRLGNSYLITKAGATGGIPEIKDIQWMNNSTMSYLLGDQVKTISVQ